MALVYWYVQLWWVNACLHIRSLLNELMNIKLIWIAYSTAHSLNWPKKLFLVSFSLVWLHILLLIKFLLFLLSYMWDYETFHETSGFKSYFLRNTCCCVSKMLFRNPFCCNTKTYKLNSPSTLYQKVHRRHCNNYSLSIAQNSNKR